MEGEPETYSSQAIVWRQTGCIGKFELQKNKPWQTDQENSQVLDSLPDLPVASFRAASIQPA
jgi:hypothetical protein